MLFFWISLYLKKYNIKEITVEGDGRSLKDDIMELGTVKTDIWENPEIKIEKKGMCFC